MPVLLERRALVLTGLAAIVGAPVLALQDRAPASAPSDKPARKKPPAPLSAEQVREFVGVAHTDLDKTRTMLDATPGLLNATWDWGAGDFETALGGASHMGRPDIANFLLERGARMDLFCAAMLGHLDVVRAAILVCPASASAPGPHGISLLAHAKQGGEPALRVVEYLESL